MIGDPGTGAQWASVIKMTELRRGECQDTGAGGVPGWSLAGRSARDGGFLGA